MSQKRFFLLIGFWTLFFSVSRTQSNYINDVCLQALPLENGQHVSFLFGLSGIDSYSCDEQVFQQQGVWYVYQGKNRVVDIMAAPEQSNRILINVFTGNCDSLTCVNTSDSRFFGDSLSTYYILVAKEIYTYGQDAVAFTLREKEVQPYDFCVSAPILECDSTLSIIPQFLTPDVINSGCGKNQSLGWCLVRGDGQTKTIFMSAGFFNEISYSVYENDCDSLVCVFQGEGQNLSIATIPGKDYLIGISHENNNLSIPIKMVMTCIEDDLNHSCTKAIPLACSETLSATLSDTLAQDFVSKEIGPYPGIWYFIEGHNGQHQISINSPTIENLVIAIFKGKNGDCISGLKPVLFNPFPLPENTYIVNSLPGENIYIKVAYFNQPVPFTITRECKPFENNQNCGQAKTLTCGDEFLIYETSRGDFGQPKNGNVGNWFVLEGKNVPYFFETQSGNGSVIFDVYDTSCDTLQPVKSVEYYLYTQNGIFLDLPEGSDYLIRTHFRNYNFSLLTMTVSCDEEPINVFCREAEEIFCGDEMIINNRFSGLSLGEDECNTSEGYWYVFEGDFSIAELVMNFPFQQYAVYEGNCDTLRCIYANEPFDGFKNFRFQTYGGVTYYIKLFGISSFGQRSFRLLCDAPAEYFNCDAALNLVCNEELTLNFEQIASPLDGDCTLENGLWYFIEGDNKLVVIEGSEDVAIQVYQNDCDSLQCKATTRGYHTFYAEQRETYFIRFASEFSNEYTVNVTCFPNAKNDCENTFDFTCPGSFDFPFGFYPTQNEGDFGIPGWFGFWGAFTGDGSTYAIKNNFPGSHQISVEIYDENCETYLSSHSLYFNETYYFPTDTGVQYKVFCSSPEPAVNGDIEVTCVDGVEGLTCDDALETMCGQQIVYHSSNRSHDYVNEIYSQSWYSFEGSGDLTNLTLFEPQGSFGYVFYVYEGSPNCDSLTEIGHQTSNDPPLYWKTTAGKQYFIQLGLSNQTQSAENWMFTLACFPYDSPENCEAAEVLVCDSIYTTSALGTENTSFGSCSPPSEGTWYFLEGNDKVVSLEITNFYDHFEEVVVYLGEGQCDQIVCTDAFVLNRERTVTEFAAFEGKSYFIKLEGQRGLPFDLLDFEITCRNQAENGTCLGATPVVCGENIEGKTKNLSNEGEDACDDNLAGLFYALPPHIGEFTLGFDISDSESFLVTVYKNTCDTGGVCLYKEEVNNQRQAIRWQTEAGETYFLRISGLGENSDDFSAKLTCDTIPLHTDCSQSLVLSCEDTIDISFVSPLGFEGESPCFFTEDARTFWYQLPATNKIMSVEILKGKEKSHYISLLTGDCANPDCLNVFDINSEFITFQKEGEFPYYLAIHGDATSSNDFSFVLRCIDGVENDECFDARPLVCGDTTRAEILFANHTPFAQDGCEINPWKDVWYELEGTGDIFEFIFTEEQNFGGFVNVFLKGECNALTCLTNGPWRNNTAENIFRFVGEAGVSYLVSVQHPVGASTSFTLQCTPRADNDLCSGAFPVVFSDTLSVALTGSTGDVDISCYEGQKEGVWYTFEGDGGFVYFSNADTLANVVEYALLEGSCDTLHCLKNGLLHDNDSLTWKTEKDRVYFLVFYGNEGKVTASKKLLADNFECSVALGLICDVTVVVGSDEIIPDQGESACANPDENTAWYVLTGDNTIKNFEFLSSGVDGSMEILTDCGETCLYRHEIVYPHPQSFSFLAVEDQKYIIKLNIARNESEHLMIMSLVCSPGQNNYSMSKAKALECGETEVEPQSGIINLLPDCYDNTFTTFWYTFTGNDSILTITDTFPEGITATIVNQNCEEIFGFTNDDLSFLTQKDSIYFLVLRYLSTDSQESFSFGVDYNCIIDQTDNVTSDLFTFKVMPNPFSDKVVLELFSPESVISEIKLTDSKGQNIWSVNQQINAGKQWFPLTEWQQISSGVYLLTLTTAKTSTTIRLVKL
jgi:hypothetical protein